MAGASLYLANALLDHVTNQNTYTEPITLYLALLSQTATASDDADTNAARELINQKTLPGTGGYARQEITIGTAATGGLVSNTSIVEFGASDGGWNEATDFWVCDGVDETAEILMFGKLTTARTVADGGKLIFQVGDIDLTLA